jgi:predicted GIY-YIG superfamily endonuclease
MLIHNIVVYKFSCPGCSSSYIGKTDRCLYTRIKEHAKSDKSEIFNHVHNWRDGLAREQRVKSLRKIIKFRPYFYDFLG